MAASDPFALDRQLKRAARSWHAYRAELRRSNAADHVFESEAEFASYDLVRELEEDAAATLLIPHRRWIVRLHEQHRHRNELAANAHAFYRELHPVTVPVAERLSVHQILTFALADGPRRKAWLGALEEHSSKLGDARLALWERRAELNEKLGAERVEKLSGAGRDLRPAATKVLELTRDAYLEQAPRTPEGLLEQLLATGAKASWPQRISLRSLVELLDAARWFEGLRLELAPLPEALAPASYVRALDRLGAAFLRSAQQGAVSFAITHDAYGLGERTLAAVFASLPLLPAFALRRLEVSRLGLPDYERALRRAFLCETRAAALRVLLVEPALGGYDRYREAFQQLFTQAFGFEPRPGLAGALLAPRSDQTQRFGGLLLGARRALELLERHDEDWFRNPRAREELRETARLPDATELSEDDVSGGISALTSRFRS